MKIGSVAPVQPFHPYLEDDPAPLLDLHICEFHLGFGL